MTNSQEPMIPFSLLVKPVGSACNLDCRYCFYKGHPVGEMAAADFRAMLGSYCALPFAAKSVTLQGGEPLLAAKGIVEALDEAPCQRAIQTNATLVTDELAERFARGGWLVGASLDGSEALNRNRGDSFKAAVGGIRRLERAGVDYNLLTVVSKANVAHPREVYRYLRDNFSTHYHQYIECTGPCEEITGEEWGDFMIGIFDEWIRQDTHTISVRMFDSIMSSLLRGYPTQCSFACTCRHYLTVEHDGGVYPCDFFVREELRMGNVKEMTWQELVATPVYLNFCAKKSEQLPEKCLKCEYLGFCQGDCPRNRQTLCAGWKKFFAHTLPRFSELVAEL